MRTVYTAAMATGNIHMRSTPEIRSVIEGLRIKTGLSQSAVITLALMELAKAWGVGPEVAGIAEGGKAGRAVKKRSP